MSAFTCLRRLSTSAQASYRPRTFPHSVITPVQLYTKPCSHILRQSAVPLVMSYTHIPHRTFSSPVTPPPSTTINIGRPHDAASTNNAHHINTTHEQQAIKHNTATLNNVRRNADKHPLPLQSTTSSSLSAIGVDGESSASDRVRATAKDKAVEATGKLKQLWGQYGYVAIATYLIIYVSTLFGIYLLYHFRLINFDPMIIVHWLGLEEHVSKYDPKAGEFALAWITTKLTEPVRLAATAMMTPMIARAFGRAPSKAVAKAMKAAAKKAQEVQKPSK